MNQLPSLITEVTRSVNDNSFSDFELFYRYFDRLPLLSFQAGSTDLYDRPAQTIREMLERDDDSNNPKENPLKGPEELNTKVLDLIENLRKALPELKKSLVYDPKTHTNNEANIAICKTVNYDSNYFTATIVFRYHKVVARVRVTPGVTETLTSITLLGVDEQDDVWKALVELGKKYVTPPQIRVDEINIITQSNGEFYLKSIPLVNNKNQNFSYENYNEGFQEISEKVLATLQAEDESTNGLVLFHGDPGTGKTSYLKYMLHTISKKKLIYLPPDLIEHLSSPNFVTFLMSQATNSILLIEDAENVLKHREVGGSQAVSNILNISDGILGDVLRLKIVCTFNSPLDQIDSALLRPGRLITEYRFESLTKDRASHLMRKLHGEDIKFEPKAMTLAEIFNYKKMPEKSKEKNRKVGFI